MNGRDALRTANLGKLGKPVGEVAKGGAGRNGDQAECGDGDSCACVQAVQQEHESGAATAGTAIRARRIATGIESILRLQRHQFALGALGGAELEAEDGASAEGVGQLLEGLRTGRVLTALDARDRGGRRTHAGG